MLVPISAFIIVCAAIAAFGIKDKIAYRKRLSEIESSRHYQNENDNQQHEVGVA